jgi:hypothetical protein
MPIVTESPNADFERRWNAWKARGLAHERVVRRRFVGATIIIAFIALIAIIGYFVFSS